MPGSRSSASVTLKPLRCKASAQATPMIPAPMTKIFLLLIDLRTRSAVVLSTIFGFKHAGQDGQRHDHQQEHDGNRRQDLDGSERLHADLLADIQYVRHGYV